MVFGLHAFHRFTVATATDGSLKEEMGPDGVMVRKVAWGATEGKGCVSGGSLPSWMEIMDAELEATFQVLVSKGDGEKGAFPGGLQAGLGQDRVGSTPGKLHGGG